MPPSTSRPTGNADATAAWELLGGTVYETQAGGWHDDTGVEWNAVGAPPGVGDGHPWDGSGARGGAYPGQAVFQAWELLVLSRAADPTSCLTFNYDVVNTGREVLAQVSTAAAYQPAGTPLSQYSSMPPRPPCEKVYSNGKLGGCRAWVDRRTGMPPLRSSHHHPRGPAEQIADRPLHHPTRRCHVKKVLYRMHDTNVVHSVQSVALRSSPSSRPTSPPPSPTSTGTRQRPSPRGCWVRTTTWTSCWGVSTVSCSGPGSRRHVTHYPTTLRGR